MKAGLITILTFLIEFLGYKTS